MPSNWLYIDTNFPAFTREESTEEKVVVIQNYLFMLVEQLRYSLHNLDLSNMNKTAVGQFVESVQSPVYKEMEATEGSVLKHLQETEKGLLSRIEDAEGNISTLTQTATELTVRLVDYEGNVAQLKVQADEIAAQVGDAEGNVGKLEVRAEAILELVRDDEGNEGALTIRANVITQQVSDAEGNLTKVEQTAKGVETRISDAEGNMTLVENRATGVETRISDANGNMTLVENRATGVETRISDANGNLTTLQQTAKGVETRISDAEGNMTLVENRATGVETRITDADGNLTIVENRAKAVITLVGDGKGNIGTLETRVNEITAQVSTAEGNIGQLQVTSRTISGKVASLEDGTAAIWQQTIQGFSLGVVNGETSSTIKLMSNGAEISSQNITLNGVVTFADLSNAPAEGQTKINGGWIDTNAIIITELKERPLVFKNEEGVVYGQVFGATSIGADGVTNVELDIRSDYSVSIWGKENAAIQGGDSSFVFDDDGCTFSGERLLPREDATSSLGRQSKAWLNLYVENDPKVTSDRRKKKNISYDLNELDAFFDDLLPAFYQLLSDKEDIYHTGFVAQDIEANLEKHNISASRFGGFVKENDENGETYFALRYGEFISLIVDQVQKLKQEVLKLKAMVSM